MKLRFILILLVLLNNILNHHTFSQSKNQTVAILEFNSTSKQIGKDELATLTNRFRTMLVKTGAFDVLERQKMSDILKEQNFTMSDNCNTAECAVQVGQLLGVELMIAGDIGKLGDTYSVDLRLISVSTGKIIQTEAQNHEGKIDGLFGTLTAIANSFAGITIPVFTTSNSSDEDAKTFTDPRDGKKYKTVKIGTQIWMAENLNYDVGDGSYCYDNDQPNCDKYGKLYTWKAASNAVPPGWHLPSKEEWEKLLNNLGGKGLSAYKEMIAGGNSGFNTVFGGWRDFDGGFYHIGSCANFWSSSEDRANDVWNCYVYSYNQVTGGNFSYGKNVGFSVRCVKD